MYWPIYWPLLLRLSFLVPSSYINFCPFVLPIATISGQPLSIDTLTFKLIQTNESFSYIFFLAQRQDQICHSRTLKWRNVKFQLRNLGFLCEVQNLNVYFVISWKNFLFQLAYADWIWTSTLINSELEMSIFFFLGMGTISCFRVDFLDSSEYLYLQKHALCYGRFVIDPVCIFSCPYHAPKSFRRVG